MWRVWGLALVAGCGRIGFDLETDARPIDAVPCTFGPFSAPQLVPNVNLFGMSQNEWAPAISGDDLTLYFYAGRGGPADIFSSTRATPTATFGAPVAIAEVSSTMTDTHPRVTSDGLVMLLASDRGGNSDLYEATRTSPTLPWGAAIRIPELATAALDWAPLISGDGLRVVFASNGGTSMDLYSAERADRTSPFQNLQPLAINSTLYDDTAAWPASELELYFSSNRPGGVGGNDIWRATRPALDQPFAAPQNVTELNSTGDDYGPALSADGSQIYYSYDAPLSGSGDANVYVATRACQ